VLDEYPGLLEGSGVEQDLDALAGGEAPFRVQLLDPLAPSAQEDALLPLAELFDGILGGQRCSLLSVWAPWESRCILSEPEPVYNAAGGSDSTHATGAIMARHRTRPAPHERRLDRISWLEFAELVPRSINTALLPIGTLEAHGVTSLGTDNEIPTRLSEAIAERVNALVAPPIPYGVTAHLGALAGGTHIPSPAFTGYAAAVITALAHQGLQNIVVMNGHGGNTESLREAARKAHEETGVYVAVFNWWIEMRPYVEGLLGAPGGHAGADETAAMLAIAPDQVFADRWDPSLAFEHRESLAAFPAPGSLLYYGGKRSDPVFNVRTAGKFWERLVEHVGEVVEDLVARWEREGMPAGPRRRGAARAGEATGNGREVAPPAGERRKAARERK